MNTKEVKSTIRFWAGVIILALAPGPWWELFGLIVMWCNLFD